jgi:predicted homoserine dehydrogenase-like protein
VLGQRGRLRRLGERHPTSINLERAALPIGLAHNVRLKRTIKKDQSVSFNDV